LPPAISSSITSRSSTAIRPRTLLNGRFGCATPDEAVATHEIFAAALQSQAQGTVVSL